ncbi:hypothetical protein ACJMK2_004478, partial [Sinanodonta woodiana]
NCLRMNTLSLFQFVLTMGPFFLIFVLFGILVAGTNGQMCRFRSERCHDVGDVRGKCSASSGICVQILGRRSCRCKPNDGPVDVDKIP